MLSIANDIRAKANLAAAHATEISTTPRQFRFHDAAYGNVEDLLNHGNVGIFIEPLPDDPAHANLVILEAVPPEIVLVPTSKKQTHQIFRDISELLKICSADDLASLKSLRNQ
jgi:hypothetical protein